MKEGMHAFIIFNPTAGLRDRKAYVESFQERLQTEHGWDISLHGTEHAGHTRELALQAQQSNADVVVVAGGDGTLNSVVQVCAGTEMPVTHLGGGTENIISREIQMPTKPHEAADALVTGKIQQADVPAINGRKFLAVAGIGLDADMISRFHLLEGGKKTRGRRGYARAIAERMVSHASIPIAVTVDERTLERKASQVFVQNSRRLGIFNLRNEGKIDDGVLEVTAFQRLIRRGGSVLVGGSLVYGYVRSSEQPPFVTYEQGSEIRMTASKPVSYQVDGDPVGKEEELTVTLRGEKNTINLWVPNKEIEIFSKNPKSDEPI